MPFRMGPRATGGAFAVLSTLAVLAASAARAEGRTLEGLGALATACHASAQPGPRHLYVVTVGPGHWSFGAYDGDDGLLPVDTRHNLRIFGGAAELYPSGLETIGFIASHARARELGRAAGGASLRVGFFLGFDDPDCTACVVRSVAAVTTVRMDTAFLEMLDSRGQVLAREDTGRYRAFRDDQRRDEVPGTGPRGMLGTALRSGGGGPLPPGFQQTVAAANQGPVRRGLAACHAAGLRHGAAGRGQVVVRMTVDGRSGAVQHAAVELSSIGNDAEDACIATAVKSALRFSPGAASGTVDISVPVRLAR